MYRFVILDVDGTILDSKKIHRKIIKLFSLLNHLSLLYAISSCTLFSYFFPRFLLKEKLAMKLDRLIFNLFDLMNGKAELFPGVKETLEDLSKNGVVLLATTVSRTRKVEQRLKKLGVLKFFNLILGGDVLPKSEHINYFAWRLDIDIEKLASQSVVVGDGVDDMWIAGLYGVRRRIGILNTLDRRTLVRAGAEEVITDLRELL